MDVAERTDVSAAAGPVPARSRGSHRAPKGERAARANPRSTGKRASGRHRRILPDRPFWIELPILVAIAIVAAFLLKTFVAQMFFIPSESMENTLLVDDRVLVDKVSYDLRDIRRGEIVVFDAEGVLIAEGKVPTDDGLATRLLRDAASVIGLSQAGDTDYIKRVIGLPGDRVACCDAQGRVTVNGVPLDETEYLFPGDAPSTTPFDVVVPADRLWVMGDHRSASADSRSRIGGPGGGFVPFDAVVGRAWLRAWPVDRFQRLGVPATFDQPAIDQNRGSSP
jgi:signal peptidase I